METLYSTPCAHRAISPSGHRTLPMDSTATGHSPQATSEGIRVSTLQTSILRQFGQLPTQQQAHLLGLLHQAHERRVLEPVSRGAAPIASRRLAGTTPDPLERPASAPLPSVTMPAQAELLPRAATGPLPNAANEPLGGTATEAWAPRSKVRRLADGTPPREEWSWDLGGRGYRYGPPGVADGKKASLPSGEVLPLATLKRKSPDPQSPDKGA